MVTVRSVRPRAALGAVLFLALVAASLVRAPAAGAAPSASGSYVGIAADTVGLYDSASSTFYLRGVQGSTTQVVFGPRFGTPLVGDWDGDGVDGLAVYSAEAGTVLFRESPLDAVGFVETAPSGGTPLAGDFDGDGVDEVAVVRAGRLLLPFGVDGDRVPLRLPGDGRAVAGDWDGDGVDEVAVVDGGVLRSSDGAVSLSIGDDTPLIGDWDGDGRETVAAHNTWRGQFTLFHGTRDGAWPAFVMYGATGMVPLSGRFGNLPGDDPAPERRLGLGTLEIGSEGFEVAILQEHLKVRGLYRGEVDGIYDWDTAYGVMTLKKVMGATRTWEFGESDRWLLDDYQLPELPDRPDEPDRIEVDIGRQVMFIFRDGEVDTVVPTSTGGSYTYYSPRNEAYVRAGTPRGDFTIFHVARGWHCDDLTGWCIYNPWSFTPYYAVHGYPSVPEYPASHGCVRVTTTDADRLFDYLYVGMPIHIWDAYDPVTNQTS